MLRVIMSNEVEFFINQSGYMFLEQGNDVIALGEESVATLEKFVTELDKIKRYLTKE